jgi:GGDEF domain-containing protein
MDKIDLSARISVSSKDEFSMLESEFNSMLAILEEVQEKNLYQSRHDDLTKLPNRSYFYKQVQEFLSKEETDNKMVGILFIDVDKFKGINDSLGHLV